MHTNTALTIGRIADSVTAVTIKDQFIREPSSATEPWAFRDALKDNAGPHLLILDLTNVKHLSSSAMGVLISVNKLQVEAGGKFAIVCANENILHSLSITRLDTILHVADTVEAAQKWAVGEETTGETAE